MTVSYADGGRTVHRQWSAPTDDGQLAETVHLSAWGAPLSRDSAEARSPTLLGRWQSDDDHRRLQSVIGIGGDRSDRLYDAYGRLRTTTVTADGGAEPGGR